MLEFLIGGGGGDKEAIFVARGQTANDSGASDGAVCNGNEICEFRFKDGVEVFGCADGDEAIAIGEICKDTNFIGVFKLLMMWLEKRL